MNQSLLTGLLCFLKAQKAEIEAEGLIPTIDEVIARIEEALAAKH